jgi:OCT family organic cation transporter-like MFS transporter 4/5
MSDRLGRRTTLMCLITFMALVLNITQFLMHTDALSINQKFALFTASRFLQGVGQTMYSVSFVLLLEITGPAHRLAAGNVLAYSFSVGQMLIASLAYHFRDWLKVHWCLALYVLPFFMYYWLVPESPRWLLSVDKVREARRVVQEITTVNCKYRSLVQRVRALFTSCTFKNKSNKPKSGEIKNTEVEPHDLKDIDSSMYVFDLMQEEAVRLTASRASYMETLRGILHSPLLMRRFLVLAYTWMVILAVYLGIGMGISGNLDKHMSPYVVFWVAAAFEFASIVTCHLALNRFGRKWPLVLFMMTTSATIYLIPVYFARRPWVSIAFYFVAKYAISAAQCTCMIWTSELYPTNLRSTGVGMSVAMARLGGVFAPQINVLSSTLGSIYVPFVIFSVLALVAGLLCAITLPETLNKQLPATLKEAKNLRRKF